MPRRSLGGWREIEERRSNMVDEVWRRSDMVDEVRRRSDMVDEVWRRINMVDEVRKRRRGPITQACKVDLGTLTSGFSFLVLLCSGSLVLAIWTCL